MQGELTLHPATAPYLYCSAEKRLLSLPKFLLSNPTNLISHPPSDLLIERRRDDVVYRRITDMLGDGAGSGQLHVGRDARRAGI